MEKSKFKNQLDLLFLGPKGEQRKLFQEMIELINNDIIFWRRNFWPKDPPVIPYKNLKSEVGEEFQDELIQNLVKLLGELKLDVPFFSPRYVAHMTGDVTLPAILSYYASLLYNSNNVSVEASPVTLKFEIEVGRMFAKLFGFDPKTSFGHITGGGTVANLESVFYNLGSRFLPASMYLALQKNKIDIPTFLKMDTWKLLNIKTSELPYFMQEFQNYSKVKSFDPDKIMQDGSLSNIGLHAFLSELEVNAPLLIAPATAHYSWAKSSNIFGLGRNNLYKVKVDAKLKMSMDDLKRAYNYAQKNKHPIIQTVAVLGSTEYGSFDPLHEIVKIRDEYFKEGLYSPIHLDAAYGGYFKTMFEKGEKYKEIAESCRINYASLYKILASTKDADSITVDPHKLGHVPYGAGVFLTKHGFTKEFISEEADYCLTTTDESSMNLSLGKYILEGSKPGASATSVYFSHKIIPLNSDGFGGFLDVLLELSSTFSKTLKDVKSDLFEFRVITDPESNLLCFFVKPKKVFLTSKINEVTDKLISKFFPRPTNHIQEFSYYLSKTSLDFMNLDELPENIKDLEKNTTTLRLARLTFMNPSLGEVNFRGISYMEDFINLMTEEVSKIL